MTWPSARPVIAMVLIAASQACAQTPTSATMNQDDPSSVIITSITPPAGETIDAATNPVVHITYRLTLEAREPRVWTCLGQTATTIILSSCRDTAIASREGTVASRPSIYFVNGRRVTRETRYVAAFLVDGDIVDHRTHYPPFEIAHGAVTKRALARVTHEHLLYWRDFER